MTTEYIICLYKAIEKAFVWKDNSIYSISFPIKDIYILAFELIYDSIKFYNNGRKVKYQTLDIYTIGFERIIIQKLELFNVKVVRNKDRIIVSSSEKRGAIIDLDPNNDIMTILIYIYL